MVLLAAVGLARLAAQAQGAFPGRNGDVAYVDSDSNESGGVSIVSTGPNGHGGATFLNGAVGATAQDPTYSPSGAELMFVGADGLIIKSSSGRGRTVIPHTRGAVAAAWAPDGQRVVFAARGNIYVTAVNGGGTPQLLRHGAIEPTWSVKGEIAYIHGGRIYEMSARGGPSHRLEKTKAACSPDWSPDGNQLVLAEGQFCDVVDGGPGSGAPGKGPVQIFTIDADGQQLTQITQGAFYNQFPVFSPDGKEIAFSRARTNFTNSQSDEIPGQRIWVMNADGSDPHQIADKGDSDGLTGDVQPTWQPLPS